MLGNFAYCNPTKLYFGDEALQYLNEELPKYGKNVVLVYGGGSIKKNGIYDEVAEILKTNGKNVTEIAGVMPNPTLEKLYEGIEIARKHEADLILAVGGGSVCDYAKAVSVSVHCDEDPWEKYYLKFEEPACEIVPVGCVLTMVGTGSEMNAGAVITNQETKLKIGHVFADENTSIVPRKGEITITASDWDKTVTAVVEVTQEAGKAVLDVSATEITANSKGKTNVSSIKVTTNKTGGFSVDNDGNSWIKLGSSSYESNPKAKVSFESEGTFYVFVSENLSDEERTGRIIVTHEDGETKEIVEVRQEGTRAELIVDSASKLVDNNGSFYNNAVYVETSDTGSFTATVEEATWLKVSSDRFASFADGMSTITLGSNAYIYLFADKNMGEERTATIKITHEGGKLTKTVTVTQLGKPASYLQVDRETAYFDDPASAVDGMVHISADENTKWTVTSSAGWIKILKNAWDYEDQYASIEGTGSGGFYIYVKENNTYKERSGYITVSAPGLESYKIYVYQVENEISLDTLLQELSISVTKKTFKKGKTTKIKLNYPEGLYASDIKSVKFSSSKKKVATVNSKGVVKGIKKGKAVITVKVTLENGSSKTFKAKITVDKRKVKLSKFK